MLSRLDPRESVGLLCCLAFGAFIVGPIILTLAIAVILTELAYAGAGRGWKAARVGWSVIALYVTALVPLALPTFSASPFPLTLFSSSISEPAYREFLAWLSLPFSLYLHPPEAFAGGHLEQLLTSTPAGGITLAIGAAALQLASFRRGWLRPRATILLGVVIATGLAIASTGIFHFLAGPDSSLVMILQLSSLALMILSGVVLGIVVSDLSNHGFAHSDFRRAAFRMADGVERGQITVEGITQDFDIARNLPFGNAVFLVHAARSYSIDGKRGGGDFDKEVACELGSLRLDGRSFVEIFHRGMTELNAYLREHPNTPVLLTLPNAPATPGPQIYVDAHTGQRLIIIPGGADQFLRALQVLPRQIGAG